MANDWILDVLADLRAFAGRNGLGITERELDHLMVVTAGELASRQGIAQGTARIGHAGELHRQAAGGSNS